MDQSGQQQQRIAGSLRTLADDLTSMSGSSERPGVANDVVREVADRAAGAATWLEQRDPGSLLHEVRQFARQRPGAFLAIAAGIGVLGGRFSRAMVDENRDDSASDGTSRTAGSGAGTQPPAPTDHSTSGYSAYGSPAEHGSTTPGGPVTSGNGGDPLLAVDPQSSVTTDPAVSERPSTSGLQEPR
jgi:hypothetical protein